MTENQLRIAFEDATYALYLEKVAEAAGAGQIVEVATREGYFWRQEDGTYGVLANNQAWFGFKAGAAAAREVEIGRQFADTLDSARWRRLLVLRDVSAERNRQDEKWGGPEHDDHHCARDWLDYVDHQSDMAESCSRAHPRSRFVKIAALAVAAVESIDRKEAAAMREDAL